MRDLQHSAALNLESKQSLYLAELGVDALWLGHFDLTNFLGIPGAFDDPRFEAAVSRIIAACDAHGKVAAFIATDESWARRYADRGFRLFAYGLDQLLLQNGLKHGLEILRQGT